MMIGLRRSTAGLLILGTLGALTIISSLSTSDLAAADEARPGVTTAPAPSVPTASPSPPQPTGDVDPAEPTPPLATPTQEPPEPTEGATETEGSTPTALVSPTPAASTPSVTGAPTTRSPTSTPAAVRPPDPPASATSPVPLADIVIAVLVLLLGGLLLRRLTRDRTRAPGAAGSAEEHEQLSPQQPASPDDVLSLLVEAGQALIDAGFDVSDVQADLHRIAQANGLPDAEIVALPTALVVSTHGGRGLMTGAVTAGRERLRLHQIERLDDIVRQSRRGLDPGEAARRIRAVRFEPPPFGSGLQLLGGVVTSASIAVLLDSSWRGVLLAAVLGLPIGALLVLGQRLSNRFQPIITFVAASLVSLAVFLLARAGFDSDVVPTLIAPLVLLLPGALLTTAVIELATGQMVAGAGRIAAGIAQLLLLGLGIVGAASLVGIPALELSSGQPALGAVGPWLAVGWFGVGIVLNLCARPRSLGWILLVLYVAYGAQVLGGVLLGGALSAFVGALAMVPVADLVARQRTGPPAIVCFTPAFWLLVPGALGLMGVATLLSGDHTGTDTVLSTLETMVAVALGVLVGRAVSTAIGLRADDRG